MTDHEIIERHKELRATAEGAFELVKLAQESSDKDETGRCLCRFMEAGLAEIEFNGQHIDLIEAYQAGKDKK